MHDVCGRCSADQAHANDDGIASFMLLCLRLGAAHAPRAACCLVQQTK